MTQRNELLDHWKLLLIVLVVLGHSIPGNPILFAAIYSFHMPAFVFLLGVTSRVRPSWRSQAETIVLLVIFQALYLGYVTPLGLGRHSLVGTTGLRAVVLREHVVLAMDAQTVVVDTMAR